MVSDEPIRPIDPAAWVSHSVAMTGAYPPFPGSSSLSTITSSSSVTETERKNHNYLLTVSVSGPSGESSAVYFLFSTPLLPLSHLLVCSEPTFFFLCPGFDDFNLSLHSDMASVAKAMASPESGLEVRDRMWLKITIPNAFLGKTAGVTAVVSWAGGFRWSWQGRQYVLRIETLWL